MPASARIVSNMAGYLPSRSRIRCLTLQPASSRSITRLRAAWPTQAAVGCAVTPRTGIRRLACSITARMYIRAPVNVTVSMKSAASSAWAWERRKSVHVVAARSGAGSLPASCRICQTVDGATLIPSVSSSPCTLRYPQLPFSRASRSTKARIDHSVRGRPRRRGRAAGAATPRRGGVRAGHGAT